MGWIRCEDGLPELYTDVFVWAHAYPDCYGEALTGALVDCPVIGPWWAIWCPGLDDFIPAHQGTLTHWMPIPALPTEVLERARNVLEDVDTAVRATLTSENE